jgi:hypothetical protein
LPLAVPDAGRVADEGADDRVCRDDADGEGATVVVTVTVVAEDGVDEAAEGAAASLEQAAREATSAAALRDARTQGVADMSCTLRR